MRYYSYNEYDPEAPDNNLIVTMSEEDIRKSYFPYWERKMIEKFGVVIYNRDYDFEDCIDDWITVNWAWEAETSV